MTKLALIAALSSWSALLTCGCFRREQLSFSFVADSTETGHVLLMGVITCLNGLEKVPADSLESKRAGRGVDWRSSSAGL